MLAKAVSLGWTRTDETVKGDICSYESLDFPSPVSQELAGGREKMDGRSNTTSPRSLQTR